MTNLRKLLIIQNLVFYSALITVLVIAESDSSHNGMRYGLILALIYFTTSILALFQLIFLIFKNKMKLIDILLIFVATPLPSIIALEMMNQ